MKNQRNIQRLRLVLGILLMLAIGYNMVAIQNQTRFPVEATEIDEASGLASGRRNKGVLYTHNDSGGRNAVYVLNTEGTLLGEFVLEGINHRDWEDITAGKGPRSGIDYLYVGEIGDNSARYSSVYVYRFEEPSLKSIAPGFSIPVTQVDRIEIQYEDGARDAEALFIDPRTRDIIIISKREEQVGVYQVAYPQSTTGMNTAVKIATLPLTWVTSADISPDGKKILVKTYTGVMQWKRKGKEPLDKTFARSFKYLPYEIEPQGEAVCWDAKGKGYYTLSERAEDQELHLFYYR